MMLIALQSIVILSGVLFYIAGTLGILRFPDTLTRLHALTKADNLGLGLIALGLLPSMNNLYDVAKVIICWLLILAAGATSGYLVGRRCYKDEPANKETDHELD